MSVFIVLIVIFGAVKMADNSSHEFEAVKYCGRGHYVSNGQPVILPYYQVQWSGMTRAHAEKHPWYEPRTCFYTQGMSRAARNRMNRFLKKATEKKGTWHTSTKGSAPTCVKTQSIPVTSKPVIPKEDVTVGGNKLVYMNGLLCCDDDLCTMCAIQHASVCLGCEDKLDVMGLIEHFRNEDVVLKDVVTYLNNTRESPIHLVKIPSKYGRKGVYENLLCEMKERKKVIVLVRNVHCITMDMIRMVYSDPCPSVNGFHPLNFENLSEIGVNETSTVCMYEVRLQCGEAVDYVG